MIPLRSPWNCRVFYNLPLLTDTYYSQCTTFSNDYIKSLSMSQLCHMTLLNLLAIRHYFTSVWNLLSYLGNPSHPSIPTSKVTSLCSLSCLLKLSLLCIAMALYSKFIFREAESLEARTLMFTCVSQHPALIFVLNIYLSNIIEGISQWINK